MHCAAQDIEEMRKLHKQILARRGVRDVNLPPIDARKSESEGPILLLIFDGGGTGGTQAAKVVAEGYTAQYVGQSTPCMAKPAFCTVTDWRSCPIAGPAETIDPLSSAPGSRPGVA